MKRLLLLCVALALSTPNVFAAPKTAKKTRSFAVLKWPRIERIEGAERSGYVGDYDVFAVQYLLRHHGFKVKPDGGFGPQTERALKAFQRSRGLVVDGVVGPQTWPRLIVRIKRGDKGDAVRAAQGIFNWSLSETGDPIYDLQDGVFDRKMELLILQGQRSGGANVDGVVGPQTWCALVGGEVVKR